MYMALARIWAWLVRINGWSFLENMIAPLKRSHWIHFTSCHSVYPTKRSWIKTQALLKTWDLRYIPAAPLFGSTYSNFRTFNGPKWNYTCCEHLLRAIFSAAMRIEQGQRIALSTSPTCFHLASEHGAVNDWATFVETRFKHGVFMCKIKYCVWFYVLNRLWEKSPIHFQRRGIGFITHISLNRMSFLSCVMRFTSSRQ